MATTLIAAIAENNAIGKDNQLLWKLREDLRRFKKLTLGDAIIMGRKTYDSIGRPLPGRENYVLTRNTSIEIEGVLVRNDLKACIAEAAKRFSNVHIIGGAQIYAEVLDLVDLLYITHVEVLPVADAYFPNPDWSDWQLDFEETFQADEKNEYSYRFCNYSRRSK